MKTRIRSLVRLLSACAAVLAGVLSAAAAPSPPRANVLLITIDTLRPDRLSCYSDKFVQTPRIDALAARGVLFERAFAHTPMTLPSHANILIGMTPPAHGVSENSRSIVAPDFLTLAEILKSRGYATGAFVGAFPLDSRFGLDQGFDVYDDGYPSRPAPGLAYSERPAARTVDAALEWLRGRSGPWFCWVHLWDPHFPYSPPEPYASRFVEDPYSGEVAYVDAELGRLLDAAGAADGAAGPLIVLTGDHGEALGEHGELTHSYFAYNSTLWVPLIISGPGVKPSRAADFVSHVDILPTVCEWLGVEAPAGLHGESLGPLLRGRRRKSRPIYFEALEAHLNRGWAPLRGLIADGKKYFESPVPELYDLETDFAETANLAPASASALRSFGKRLETLMRESASPLSARGARPADRETRERLRSLGYLAAAAAPPKKTVYGPEDDLKTLLPLERKLDRATVLNQQGRRDEALALLEELAAQRPDFGKAYDLIYAIRLDMGQADEGLAVLRRGMEANPENFVMVSGYGIALVKNGRMQEGADVLELASGLFDGDAEVWNGLGVAHGSLGDDEKAGEYLERALALDPNDAIFNDNAGTLHVRRALRRRDPEEARRAVESFRKSLAADPELASAHNGLGGALKILGQADEAIASWERALAIDPAYEMTVYNLAVAYLEKGEKAKALESCRRYLALRGDKITAAEREEIDALMRKARG